MFLGSMPLKRDQITEEQNKYQQLGGLLACDLVVILMLLGMDIASWVAIAALAVGWASAIPRGERMLLARFPMLKPAKPQSPLRKAKPRKR